MKDERGSLSREVGNDRLLSFPPNLGGITGLPSPPRREGWVRVRDWGAEAEVGAEDGATGERMAPNHLGGCGFFPRMKNPRSLKPYEQNMPPMPANVVPTTGGETLPDAETTLRS